MKPEKITTTPPPLTDEQRRLVREIADIVRTQPNARPVPVVEIIDGADDHDEGGDAA
jgi:hypothetical protein